MNEPGFNLFVYGSLRRDGEAAHMMADCEHIMHASVNGTLYDCGRFPALMLYGRSEVHGEVWRCPAHRLEALDSYEGVQDGAFRRVGVRIDGLPCWTYVAGPALSRTLTPQRVIRDGRWPRTRA